MTQKVDDKMAAALAAEPGSLHHLRMQQAAHALQAQHGDVLEYVKNYINVSLTRSFFNTEPGDKDGREFLYAMTLASNTIFATIDNFAAEHEAQTREKEAKKAAASDDADNAKPETF